MIRITHTIRIRQGRIGIDGQTVMEETSLPTFGEFIRAAYKFAGMSYPKFYKMDDLCKLALVGAELLLKDGALMSRHTADKLGLLVQNGSSTLVTDTEYQRTIDDRANYFPSPAVFVYTLPNIMLGEICIKHKLFGENALLAEAAFMPEHLIGYADLLFSQQRITACVAGWIEQTAATYDAFLYLAESAEDGEAGMEHTAANLNQLYNS